MTHRSASPSMNISSAVHLRAPANSSTVTHGAGGSGPCPPAAIHVVGSDSCANQHRTAGMPGCQANVNDCLVSMRMWTPPTSPSPAAMIGLSLSIIPSWTSLRVELREWPLVMETWVNSCAICKLSCSPYSSGIVPATSRSSACTSVCSGGASAGAVGNSGALNAGSMARRSAVWASCSAAVQPVF